MMLAARMNYDSGEFDVVEVPVPEPGSGEVRVKMKAAGVCLSDVHLIDGSILPATRPNGPVTLGHEVAGVIDQVGPQVSGVPLGARVTVLAGKAVNGDVQTLGADYDGGWAEYLVVPVESLVPIPDSLSFEEAAIIPDAVATPWAAIKHTGRVRAGESVGVWGIGGLGYHAITLLRLIGAMPILALDPLQAARDRALRAGADVALDPTDSDLARRIREATGGHGLDVAFDFAGISTMPDQAVTALGNGGRLVLVGLHGGPLTIQGEADLAHKQIQVLGHYGSLGQDVPELIRFTELGRLDLSHSISQVRPLAHAAQAVVDLRDKVGHPIRIILKP